MPMTTPPPTPHRLIVAITGASGAVYGVKALELLRRLGGIETHLILTASGARTLAEETDVSAAQVRELAGHQRAGFAGGRVFRVGRGMGEFYFWKVVVLVPGAGAEGLA